MNKKTSPSSALFPACVMAAVLVSTVQAQGTAPFPTADPKSVGLDPAALAAVVERVEAWVEAGRIVGAEVLVIKDRRIVLHEARGMKDRERGIKMERDTIFRIRSMTKPIVATAVLMLADEGKLELGDPASRFLPSFRNDKSRAITLEQLLTHTVGFPQPGYPEGLASYKDLRAAIDAVGKVGPPRAPGQVYSYSDADSATLGVIVAELSGMPVETFIEKRVLEPLGMNDTLTNLGPDEVRRPRISSTYVKNAGAEDFEKYWQNTEPQTMPFFRASGGIYTTPMDYARFLAMWMDRGRVGEARFLSAARVERALVPHPMSRAGGNGYGQHWGVYLGDAEAVAEGKLPAFGHSGSDGTIARALPEEDLMVFYFTQSRRNDTLPEAMELLLRAARLP